MKTDKQRAIEEAIVMFRSGLEMIMATDGKHGGVLLVTLVMELAEDSFVRGYESARPEIRTFSKETRETLLNNNWMPSRYAPD